ncbi:MAG: polyribonucleotide nucleotidyltransferase [Deltaproteobacteria bacterium]|nr:polyribonucleotide nucleotidyltransferase [Deltaproteobacteria bacterium]
MFKTVECELGGQPLVIETGRVAKQANGSAVVRYGDTMVLVTAVSTDEVREGIDFFPLTVDYQELAWAAGRIPGNFFRREMGRPSLKETLTSRLIDRPLRPRFPKGYKFETQIIANVISSDTENDADVLALCGASTALCISDIPWQGPIAGCRVGRVDGQWLINPTQTQLEESDLNLIVAASREAIVMVEGGANYVPEEEILEAIYQGHQALQPVLDVQEEMIKSLGRAKRDFAAPQPDLDLAAKVRQIAEPELKKASVIPEKLPRYAAYKKIKKDVLAELGEDYADKAAAKTVGAIIEDLKFELVRSMILNDRRRIDGRGLEDVRPVSCEVGVLPRAHGSALFTRGETQALVTVTLGTSGDEQRIENIMGDSQKRFFLHYNFPPFSVAEAKMLRGPSRRDIGHGALAERALAVTLPPKEEFQYTIRIVSDILESNGSSSMATVCGGSLALMDAAVPVDEAIAGVAMGLIKEGDQIAILTDILGDEDHLGDMDFKVAGSAQGVSAIQMDIKIPEVDRQVMGRALSQAREGRLHILEVMNATISQPRAAMSEFAPQIVAIQIKPEQIRDIIGPGGKIIKSIQNETGCKVDVEDSGRVLVASHDRAALDQAIDLIKGLTKEAEVGAVYEGVVKKVTDFGAFIEVLPGTDGLCHISELEHHRVNKVTDVLNEGDEVKVKVIGVDPSGKIKLSRKALLEPPAGGQSDSGRPPRGPRPRHRRESN